MEHIANILVTAEHADLAGRVARCTCGREAASDRPDIAFLEYCGPGSRHAVESCAACHYLKVAHDRKAAGEKVTPRICDHFTPAGDLGHDRYYCGCRGWD